MAKVKLLKQVGQYPVGTELEIKDKTVLDRWEELGVIESSKVDLSKMKVDELKVLAEDKDLPKEEWESLKKEELITYLSDK